MQLNHAPPLTEVGRLFSVGFTTRIEILWLQLPQF
jgi:hypothetical protein